MRPFDPKGKVVLITGASSGIGQETALLFAAAGASVALIARKIKDLEAVAQKINDGNGNAKVFPYDLSQIDQIPALVQKVTSEMGAVDVLINNAGYAVGGLVADCPIDQYKRNLEINFFAPLALIQSVLPDLKKKKSGQIINVSSGVGKRALPGFSAYSVTKFALNGLTESLRVEVKRFGIDVIAIFPGRVESHFHERIESYGTMRMKLPPIRCRPARDVAQMILKASRTRAREKTIFGPGAIGAHLNYWAPRFVDNLLAKRFPTD